MKKILLTALMFTLAACGGGSGDDSGDGGAAGGRPQNSSPLAPPTTSTTPPADDTSGTPVGGTGGSTTDIPPDRSCFVGLMLVDCDSIVDLDFSGMDFGNAPPVFVDNVMDDIEPNNTFDESSVAWLPFRSADNEVLGFHVDGTTNRDSDPVDYFSFTVEQPGFFEFRLCEADTDCSLETLDSRMDLDLAELRVLTAYGDDVERVEGSIIAGNVQSFWIDTGLHYYVRVRATAADSADVAYRLRVREMSGGVSSVPTPDAPVLYEQVTRSELTVTIDWLPPTQYDDGSVLTDIRSYVIYLSTVPGGPYAEFETLTSAGLTSHTFNLPHYGDWYVVMATIDADGVVGSPGNEIWIDAPELPDPAGDGTG